jgi:single-stranded-DNA-specific exonuclease
MKNMEKAVYRIVAAVKNNQKICIYGDYDVDGITSVSLMMLFLREINADVCFYVPSRLNEGYGLNIDAIKKIRQNGTNLLITVDCGISDFDSIMFANSTGLDVIVTDHHETPEALVPAYTILNPKQPGCRFPFKGLAGVGVAFNLVMALRKALREGGAWEQYEEPNLKKYLDLVALGTIADVVPMLDENRIFVRNGLEVLSEGKRPGIKALMSVSGVRNDEITSSLVAYRISPRINASGRLSDASICVRILLSGDYEEALAMAKKIDEENTKRQQIGRKILAEARSMTEKSGNISDALIFASADWHPGVLGLCASRLCDEFHRPSILIAVDEKNGTGRGSARSIDGFDIYSVLKKCASVLSSFGGHKDAAGLTVPIGKIDQFIEKFNSFAKEGLLKACFSPTLAVDAEISLGMLSFNILKEIETLSPFGPCNPEPVFSSHDIRFYSSMVVGNGHLKLKIKENGQFYEAIGFNMAKRYFRKQDTIRLAFVPQFNSFRGDKTIQLNLRDIKGI